MALLDNAIWLTAADGSAESGSTTISEGGNSTTVTSTFTPNSWNATQNGYNVTEFGAFGISTPITADYVFSNPVEDLTFDFQHVNSQGSTYDDMHTIYAYDENGDLLDSADVIAGLSNVRDDTIVVNPDGSVSIEADGGNPNDITLVLPGQISQLSLVLGPGPDGTQTGGSGIGDFTFTIPTPPLDDIVEGSDAGEFIGAGYGGDPEGDTIDANDSTGAQTGNPGSNQDYVLAGGGNDTVEAGADADEVYGEAGDDSLLGQGGDDDLYGGIGNDELYGGAGSDALSGGDDDDLLDGGAEQDKLDGGSGDDTLIGGGDADQVHGGDGDDTFQLHGNDGLDTIVGGEGDETNGDTLDLSTVTDDLNIDLRSNDPEAGRVYGGSNMATFSEIENITLGQGRDTIILADGSGDDAVQQFDMADSGDGSTNDQLNVAGLTSDGGTTPVTAWDVVVTDTNGDGTGDAILTFPGGESITLIGVLPSEVDSVPELHSIGIPCFTPGTRIATGFGDKRVEDIRPGDLVLTVDNGMQPVRWVGRRDLGPEDLAKHPNLRPVIIRKGAFNNRRALRVSPQHAFRVARDGKDRLIRAKHAAQRYSGKIAQVDQQCREVSYIHVMFDSHQLIFAEGAVTEAFYPGGAALRSLGREALKELLLLFPELAETAFGAGRPHAKFGPPARPYLSRKDSLNFDRAIRR